MMSPLSSRRYTELVDRINGSFGLFREYLELRIKMMKIEMAKERSANIPTKGEEQESL